MLLYADDHLTIRISRCDLFHRIPEIREYRLQLKHILQQSVIAANAQRLTPLCVCRQLDQITYHPIVKAEGR